MLSLAISRAYQRQLRLLHSYITRTSASSDQFRVRRLQTTDEVAILIAKAAALGWKPGALDHVSYFAADNTGFFVGELNGKVVSSMSAVKYSDKSAFLGHFIVDKPYRGTPYAKATRLAALASLPEGCNIAWDVLKDYIEKSGRELGVVPAWRNRYVTIAAAEGLLALADVRDPPKNVRMASDVKFSDLLEYDTSIRVYSRPSFLHKWISSPNCFAFVATGNDGAVVGYTVVRTIWGQEHEWKLGPLCADNSQIAKSLYKTVFEKVAADDPTAIIGADVPFGDSTNPDALDLMKDLPSTLSDAFSTRFYKHGVPSELQLQKIFALTSTSI